MRFTVLLTGKSTWHFYQGSYRDDTFVLILDKPFLFIIEWQMALNQAHLNRVESTIETLFGGKSIKK